MTKIAIVGNREGWKKTEVFEVLDKNNIKKTDLIISGGARGVDSYAQEYAKKIGAPIRIIYPDPNKPSPEKYFERNEKIALLCDKMVAFDREDYEGGGTKNIIMHAKKLDKELIIVEK